MRRSRITLAAWAMLLLSVTGLRAQAPPPEYNFQMQRVIDGEAFNSNGDPSPVLSMDCLVANGYGQWTLSSTHGQGSYTTLSGSTTTGTAMYPIGWYLLENALRKPSTQFVFGDANHPGCIPPGVVNCGSLTYSGEIKATANLDGMVAFVSPHPGRNSFDVSGFTSADVDLSASALSLPAPPINVITHSIHAWPAVSTAGQTIVTTGGFRDRFDVCSDASFIYIVWNVLAGSTNQVWVMAFPIASSSPVVGPVQVDAGSIDNDIFPTITCDPRTNRGGGTTPAFDIAYIDLTTNQIMIRSYSSGSFGAITALASTFTDPGSGLPITWKQALHARILRSSVFGSTSSLCVYAIVNNDRVALGLNGQALIFYSTSGIAGPANYVAGTRLSPPSPLPSFPFVCDGPITAFANPYDNQAGWQKTDQFHCLYQYDLGTAPPNEFPLVIVRGSDCNATHPTQPCTPLHQDTRLLLNLGLTDPDNNWYVAAVNQMGIHIHWRSLGSHFYSRDISRTFDEPMDESTMVTDICMVTDGSVTGTNHGGESGATLQQGKSMLIYTDPNYGADPFEDLSNIGNTNSGLYQPAEFLPSDPHSWWQTLVTPPVGTLLFSRAGQTIPNSIDLRVGDGSSESGATLTVMPNFYILFPSSSQEYGMSVRINGGSTLNYYGIWGRRASYADLSQIGGTSGNLIFGSAQITQNSEFIWSVHDGEGKIDLEGNPDGSNDAKLIVHGGANFQIADDCFFTSNFGNIDIRDEPNIYPLLTTGTTTQNPDASGIMTFEGQAYLSHSSVGSHMPIFGSIEGDVRSNHIIIHVPGSFYGDNPGDPEASPGTPYYRPYGGFYSEHTSYRNTGYGLGVIQFDQKPLDDVMSGIATPLPYQDVNSNYDNFWNVEIVSIDPQNKFAQPHDVFNITNGTFSGVPYHTIDIERATPLAYPYYGKNILISGNSFSGTQLTSCGCPEGGYTYPQGYFIYASQLRANIDSLSKLTVETNTFDCVGPGVQADIWFNQSDGLIGSNTVPYYSWFEDGIKVTGYHTSNFDLSFLCNNNISGGGASSSIGIETSDYQGYIKLNTINGNGTVGTGWWHHSAIAQLVPPHLLCTKIYYCTGNGIKVDATVDLTGLHHDLSSDEPGDMAGYNEIYDNTGAQVNIASTTTSPNVWVYQSDYPSSWSSSTAGFNNIYQTTSGSSVLINGISYGNTPVDISNCYWGSGGTPPSSSPSTTYWPGFAFTCTTAVAKSSIPSISCSGGLELTRKGGAAPQSILAYDSCHEALGAVYNWEQADINSGMSYDTMKWYITNCYKTADAGKAWGGLGGAQDSISQTAAGRLDFHNFVIYALTLRNDDDWFCLGFQLLGDFYVDPIGNIDYPSQLAIYQFLVQNPRCAGNYTNDSAEYYILRETQYTLWQDTAHSGEKFDTTIPTLHQLGLDTPLKYAAASNVHFDIPGSEIIGNASIMPNPTMGEATVSLAIEREAYVHIEVFDLLGNKINDVGYEGVFETGTHTTLLDLSRVPPGSYYIRISTANNEVRTLKLVKE